jgi:hypothetical protein
LISCGCAKKASGPELETPQFQVAVKLSDKAESKLRTQNETVKVIAYFSGQPNGTLAAKVLTSEQGRIDLGVSAIELNGSGAADFSKIGFSPKHADLVQNGDYQVLINVVSGRRSSQLNLLECDSAGGKLSTIQHKTLNVQCKLIGDE